MTTAAKEVVEETSDEETKEVLYSKAMAWSIFWVFLFAFTVFCMFCNIVNLRDEQYGNFTLRVIQLVSLVPQLLLGCTALVMAIGNIAKYVKEQVAEH